MAIDFIPRRDTAFDPMTTAFADWTAANGAGHGVSPALLTKLAADHAEWAGAWSDFLEAQRAFNAALQAKDTARKKLTATVRAAAAVLQSAPSMTNAERSEARLTVPKQGHTRSTTPDTAPMLLKVDSGTRGLLRYFIADSTTPNRRAKPDNVRCMEIRQQIGGTAPVNPEEMDYLALASRTPYLVHFEPEDVGKPVYFAFRWIGKNNVPGPWSMIYSKLIPA